MIALGAGGGLIMAIIAMPDLSRTFTFEGREFRHFSGIIATALRTISDSSLLHAMLITALAAAGGAGLGALAALTWPGASDVRETMKGGDAMRGIVNRLQFWTLVVGWALFALSATPVYDRYVLAWTILLPIVWTLHLPRAALALQMLALSAIAAYLVWQWLM